MQTFYDVSGGMESAAMLVLDRERIRDTKAIVRFAETGKQFPEMHYSLLQIEERLKLNIICIQPRITFGQFLFERGGIVKKGTNDCSRRMKRSNLKRHMLTYEKPYEVNLGFNNAETERAESFSDRNERPWCHWRYPLIETNTSRERTHSICHEAGFNILVGMYEKMGRFDCFFCGNQSSKQALKVVEHYPELAKEWMETEDRKKHSFMKLPLRVLVDQQSRQGVMDFKGSGCACFGGSEDIWEDDQANAS